ncbi:MAG: family 20 glycosylhydrolase [Saprospiraceae bacterium]
MKRIYSILFLLIFYAIGAHGQYNIIPKPKQMIYGAGELKGGRLVHFRIMDNGFEQEVSFLKDALEKRNFTVDEKAADKPARVRVFVIVFKKDNTEKKPEAYQIKVNEDGLTIASHDASGMFRGVVTALQLLPNKFRHDFKMPYCTIKDEPVFGWRGLMLDVSRHFFSVEDVKRFIDRMALYKFNVFHWHLTDDEGWRIEIKAYPQLTSKGAWRVARTGKFGTRPAPKSEEPTPYGGFYTQEEIKEVVDYAKSRHITVVPEIDVPGHSMALLAAFPELCTKKEAKMVSCGFKFAEWYGNGTFKMLVENMLNPSDPRVYEVLDTIFGEVAELFPGEYIHAGGDECDHSYWKEDANCNLFMQQNGLKDVEALQAYFMSRVNKIIQSKGKKMIGWDEILYGGLAEGAAVMSWRGNKGGIEAAAKGHKVVMSPTTNAYLDYTQGDPGLEFPIYASLSLKKCFDFEVVPPGVDSTLVMGGQGNLWTEHIPVLSHAFYMTYPRALALSENLWSSRTTKDWNDFTTRLEFHFNRFENDDLPICKALYDPFLEVKRVGENYFFTATTELPEGVVHYTTDNTFPHSSSPIATTEKIAIPEGEVIVRAAVFKNNEQLGRTLSLTREALLRRAK